MAIYVRTQARTNWVCNTQWRKLENTTIWTQIMGMGGISYDGVDKEEQSEEGQKRRHDSVPNPGTSNFMPIWSGVHALTRKGKRLS